MKMGRMRFDRGGSPLRDRLFELLRDSPSSAAEDLQALLQCATQIQDRFLVEKTARECGLRLSGFRSNDDLEFYYDMREGRRDVGYISKGWDDPGFRVGDIVEVPKSSLASVKQQAYAILKFCAVNGVVVTVEEKADTIELQMDSVIYSDGFSKRVFEQVLHHLGICVEKAQEMVG
jgi:hypothetical protein